MATDDTQAPGTEAPAAPATDTATTQPSEAGEQQSQATPEATQVQAGQEPTQTEVKTEDTVTDKLYAGKYKSIEDLENAYKSAESKLGQSNTEKAELSRILNEAFAPPPPPRTSETATDTGYTDDEPDPVKQEIEGLKRTTAVQSFIMNHPDVDASAMNEVLTKDPLIAQISGHDAKLEYAYLRSQNMARPKAIAEAEKKAAQAAQAKTVEKQAAQVETAKQTEPINEGVELMNQATQGTPDQRKAARLSIIKKNLVNL